MTRHIFIIKIYVIYKNLNLKKGIVFFNNWTKLLEYTGDNNEDWNINIS